MNKSRGFFGSAPIKREGDKVVYDEVWDTPIEYRCYDWLRQAYPEVFKQFHAVDDIERQP